MQGSLEGPRRHKGLWCRRRCTCAWGLAAHGPPQQFSPKEEILSLFRSQWPEPGLRLPGSPAQAAYLLCMPVCGMRGFLTARTGGSGCCRLGFPVSEGSPRLSCSWRQATEPGSPLSSPGAGGPRKAASPDPVAPWAGAGTYNLMWSILLNCPI